MSNRYTTRSWQVVDRLARSLGFLTWIQQPENEAEILALYYTAKEFGKTPSDYAFGPDIPLQSKFEIDLFILAVGKAHEAELADTAEQGTGNL